MSTGVTLEMSLTTYYQLQLISRAMNLASDAVISARQGEALHFIASLAKEASGDLERASEHLKLAAGTTSSGPLIATVGSAGPPAAAALGRAMGKLSTLAQQAHEVDKATLGMQAGVAASLNALIKTASTCAENAHRALPIARVTAAAPSTETSPGFLAMILALVVAVVSHVDEVAGRLASALPFLAGPYTLARCMAVRLLRALDKTSRAPATEVPWVAINETWDMGMEAASNGWLMARPYLPPTLHDSVTQTCSAFTDFSRAVRSDPLSAAAKVAVLAVDFAVTQAAALDVAWGVTEAPARILAYLPSSLQSLTGTAFSLAVSTAKDAPPLVLDWAIAMDKSLDIKTRATAIDASITGGMGKNAVAWIVSRAIDAYAFALTIVAAFWHERAKVAARAGVSGAGPAGRQQATVQGTKQRKA